MDKITRTMKEASSKVDPEIFNVNNAEDQVKLVELLANRVNLPTRDLFKTLGQVYPNGIKVGNIDGNDERAIANREALVNMF